MSIRKAPKGYRFPVSVISHVVWLYHRFNNSYRDVKEQLLYRGIELSHETVSRGLIKRKSSNSHGRILLLELTKKGQKIVSSAHEIIRVVETRMLSTMNDEHKVQLESLLLECFNNLNNADQK